jgi:hypothetical protein
MPVKPVGLYRSVGASEQGICVLVQLGALRFHIPEQKYRDEGFEPAFDRLPWGGPSGNQGVGRPDAPPLAPTREKRPQGAPLPSKSPQPVAGCPTMRRSA